MAKKLKTIKTDKPFWMFTDNADEDYLVARLLTFCGSTMWHAAAYHSHQAIEKYIKSYLVQEHQEYSEIHNLKELGNLAAKTNSLFKDDKIKELLDQFDMFEQVSRYGGFANYDPLSKSTTEVITAGGFMWTGSNILQLDELVFKIRGLLNFSSSPSIDKLKAILEDNKEAQILIEWKLPNVTLKELLTSSNKFYK